MTDTSESAASHVADHFTPWLLLLLASLAGLGAVLRIVGDGRSALLERLDETTVLYLGVGGALLLLRQVKALSFGTYKLEMLERVRAKQAKQENRLEEFSLMLPLLLPETERKHLFNLLRGRTTKYRGSHAMRAELRRLRSIGLIQMKDDKHIGGMRDGAEHDLAEFVELTPLGKKWMRRIEEIERVDGDVERTLAEAST